VCLRVAEEPRNLMKLSLCGPCGLSAILSMIWGIKKKSTVPINTIPSQDSGTFKKLSKPPHIHTSTLLLHRHTTMSRTLVFMFGALSGAVGYKQWRKYAGEDHVQVPVGCCALVIDNHTGEVQDDQVLFEGSYPIRRDTHTQMFSVRPQPFAIVMRCNLRDAKVRVRWVTCAVYSVWVCWVCWSLPPPHRFAD
jgi:hypothetical protein